MVDQAEDPWANDSFTTIFGSHLLKGGVTEEHLVPTDEALKLNGEKTEFYAVYFGGHWSPADRLMVKRVNDAKKNSKGVLEVIFVSADIDADHFERNFMGIDMGEDEGNFRDYPTIDALAIPFKDEQKRKDLQQRYAVEEIPSIAIVDLKRTTLECHATKRLEQFEHWREVAEEIYAPVEPKKE